MRIGLTEILVIAVIILAVLKPEKLGEYTKVISNALKNITHKKEEIKEAAEPVVEPVKEAMKPVTDLKNEINNSIQEINDELKNNKEE